MIDVRRTFRIARMMFRAFRRYRWRFALMIVLGLTAGFFGGIGITAAIPLFSLFAPSGSTLAPDAMTRVITGFFAMFHLPLTPAFLMAFIVLLFVAKAAVQFFSRYVTDKTMLEFSELVQKSLFRHTLRASWPHLLQQKVGYLERLVLNDARNAAGMLGLVGGMIMLATSVATYGTVALSISIPITLATAAFGLVLFFIVKPMFTKTRRLTARMAALEKEANHYLTENIIGMKLVKAHQAEITVATRGKTYFATLRKLNTLQVFYSYLTGAFAEPVSFGFIAILFLLSYRSDGFNIVAFGIIMYLVQRIFSFIQSLQGQLQSINGMVPYLQAILQYRREVVRNAERDEGTKPFRFAEAIEFRQVSFAYQENRTVLSGISFRIPKGSMVGIVGPSGSGKTTIVDLLLRLFAPTSGEILVDRVPLVDIKLAAWRGNIGYVAQEIFLLNDTIANNIRFFDNAISDSTVREAAALANVTEFTDRLSEGLQTSVGERGVELSGGQRQRIALARALARRPTLLILDEATSNLDAASESAIQRAILGIKRRVTIIAIAHRLSTLENADQIIELHEGYIQKDS